MVVAMGWNQCGQWNVSGCTDTVQVSTRFTDTVGLKSDGTVVAVCLEGPEISVNEWDLWVKER